MNCTHRLCPRATSVVLALTCMLSAACDEDGAGAARDAGTQDSGTTDPSAACGAARSRYGAGTSAASIAVGGTERTFRVHVPPGYQPDRPAALVVLLHGGGGSGEQLELRSSAMNPIADREGFITVYPDGTGIVRTWNGGLCCGRAVADDIDDVGFVAALLDHLEAELCVDRRRVFAMGMSNGGLLSHRLGCELSSRIAAIAPIAGTIGINDCAPPRPVPVLQIHGTADGHVPWEGGVGCGPSNASFTSVPLTIDIWRTQNGCGADTERYFSEGNGGCSLYNGCRAPVVLCAIDGGGHSWPGGALKQDGVECPADGPQSRTFNASEVAWRFFQAHPRD